MNSSYFEEFGDFDSWFKFNADEACKTAKYPNGTGTEIYKYDLVMALDNTIVWTVINKIEI
jgi:hypothetical protein